MFKVNTAGVDLAKNVVQIHGASSGGASFWHSSRAAKAA